jgi:hypothetical protein
MALAAPGQDKIDHRLGNGLAIIAKTHSKTATKEDNFHEILLELKKDRER